MASYLKPRRGTYSTASSKLRRSADGVLKNGEIFFELNNSGAGKGVGKIKMGDGSTDYSSLSYFLSLQDSPITFTATESTDQISSLKSGVSIPNAFRYIKSSLAYLKTQVTNLNNDLYKSETATFNGNGNWTAQVSYTIPKTGKYLVIRGAWCTKSDIIVGRSYNAGDYCSGKTNEAVKFINVELLSQNDIIRVYTFSTGYTVAGLATIYISQ